MTEKQFSPLPWTPGLGAQSSRGDQTSLEGGVYLLTQRVRFNRLMFRIASSTGSPTIALGIYQGEGGGAGIAKRVASAVGVAISGQNNYTAVFTDIDVLEQGFLYLLHGRDSGSGSYQIQTYGIQAYNLLNQNMPSGWRPVSFTTALAASDGLPATFDPRESGVGQAIPTTLNVLPVIGLEEV